MALLSDPATGSCSTQSFSMSFFLLSSKNSHHLQLPLSFLINNFLFDFTEKLQATKYKIIPGRHHIYVYMYVYIYVYVYMYIWIFKYLFSMLFVCYNWEKCPLYIWNPYKPLLSISSLPILSDTFHYHSFFFLPLSSMQPFKNSASSAFK